MNNVLYEWRDQSFTVTVLDTDMNTVIPASSFENAQYRVFPKDSEEPVLSKSLGDGIVVEGDLFVVSIADDELTISGTRGEYSHVFVVGTTPDELLPSIIDSPVDIIPGKPI